MANYIAGRNARPRMTEEEKEKEKKKQAQLDEEPAEIEYLVRGAVLACRAGSSPSQLNLPRCHGVYAKKHPIMNMQDYGPNVNIMPFGKCSIMDKPCSPAIAGPWLEEHKKTIVTDAAAITMESFLVCTIGGLIEPQTSGQET